MDEDSLERTVCPKCGHEQAFTDECSKCGVIISKFKDIKQRSEFNQRIRFKQPIVTKIEKPSHRIIKWIMGTVIFLFVGAVTAFVYMGNRMTDTHRIHSTTQQYCDSFARTFPAVCEYEGTCCYDCLISLMHSGDYERSELEELFQNLIPKDEIRDLGFLIAKSVKISKDAKIPILICKTAIVPLRSKYGGPPGKDHLVVYPNHASSWMIPSDYEALDKSEYVDIEMLIKKYNETNLE